ncbi:hypothetical protein LSH36_122g08031 [Paralvinella palmiformis]|uniref:RING-type domain-containing protein n=1 Tax=Paralvinella palmiformis TaxID=53620 RepID=A0AAD9JXA0_9ANNE|nr:hypothetical protein LSH36_122g08031 [Paralvinella palmiformis]
MPPKQLKSKAVLKAELKDKLREIRVKQQNWLQERESSLNISSTINNNKSEKQRELSKNGDSSAPPVKPKQSSPNGNISSPPVHGESPQNIKISTKMPTKSGFHTWISNRQIRTESPQVVPDKDTAHEYNPSNYLDYNHHREDDHTDMPPLRLPSSCSATSSTGSKETDPDPRLDEYHNRVPQTDSLSPEKFDALADEIVNRVKRELHLEKREMLSSEEAPARKVNSDSVRTESTDYQSSNNNGTCDISSHKCPMCHELMLPPKWCPQLLIPCGHTSCQKCIKRSQSCLICNHPIQSSTPNIMLQQIIISYHQRSPLPDHNGPHDQLYSDNMPSVSKRSQQVETNGPKIHQLGKTYSQMPSEVIIPETPRKTAEEYEEEYHNLLLRCDVLRDEEQVICDKMASLEQQKQTEHQQIENISTTQKRLQQDIKKLQKQIEDLDSHKEGYRFKIDDLDAQKKKEKRRLELIRSTINQLKDEIKKIKKELQCPF